MAENIGSSSGLVGAYATLAANVFAVTAAFGALNRAAQVQQVIAGLDAMGNRMGTTLDVAASKLQKLTGFAISNEQAFRATAQIASSGLGAKAIQDLGQVATDTSFALGRSLPEALDRLTRGVVKLEPELLDELGIMTKLGETNQRLANSLGKSESALSSYEKRQGFLNAVVAEGTAKFGGLSDAAGNTKNLDRLAATFGNLTNDILTFINSGALPLAGLFSNKGFLLGGMILFASTISKQLLPGLSDLAKQSAKTSAELLNVAKNQATSLKLVGRSPKAFGELVGILKEGKDPTLEQLDKANAAVVARISNYQKTIDKLEQKGGALTAKQENKLADAGQAQRSLDQQRKAVNDIIALRATASRATKEADAITAAGNRELNVSYRLLTQAVREYHAEQLRGPAAAAADAAGSVGMLAGFKMFFGQIGSSIRGMGTAIASMNWKGWAAAGTSALTIIRTGSYAASVGVRVLGAAFLNLIPVIGQIILVVTLLWEGITYLIDKFRGPEIKAFNEAIAEQEKISGNLGKRLEEIGRLNSANIAANVRQAKSYEVITNSVRENIDAYEASAAAQAKLPSSKAPTKFGDTAEFKALKALKDSNLPEVGTQIEAALGKEGLTGFLEQAKTQVDKGTLEKVARILSVELRQGAVVAGDSLRDLTENFKTTEVALNNFNRSSIITTQYDEIAKQTDGLVNSFTNLSTAAAKSEDMAKLMGVALLEAGPALRNLFTVDTQNLISQYEALNEAVNKLGDKAPAADKARLRGLEQALSLRTEEVYRLNELLIANQDIARQTANQIERESSRLELLRTFTSVSMETTKRRMDSENRIIQLQIRQIKSQKQIVDMQIAQLKLTLSEEKSLLSRNSIYSELLAKMGEGAKITATDAILIAQKQINFLNGYKKGKSKDEQAAIDAQIDGYVQMSQAAQAVVSTDTRLRDGQAQAQALATKTATLQDKIESKALITATGRLDVAKAILEISQRQAAITNDQIKRDQTIFDINTKLSGRVQSTADEYNNIVKAQTLSLAAQKKVLSAQKDSNVAALLLEMENAKRVGASAEIANLQQRINLEEASYNNAVKQLALGNQLEILNKYAIDTQKEGLDMQVQALNLYEKMFDAKNNLVNLAREQRNLEDDIVRRRAGISDSEDNSRAREIEAARDNFKMLSESASIRKSLITLEFALLEAQRVQNIANLKAQAEALKLIPNVNMDQVKQLEATVKQLEGLSGTTNAARDSAVAAVDQTVKNAALELAKLQSGRNSGVQTISSAVADLIRLNKARTEKVGPVQGPDPKIYVAPIIASNSALVKAVEANTEATIKSSTISPQEQASSAARAANDNGFRVSELGAKTGHRGVGHREGRAFDLNIGTGNVEANNPAMDKKMLAFIAELQKAGATVLYKVAGHFDHAHVEFKKSVETAVTSVMEANKAIIEEPMQTVSAKIDTKPLIDSTTIAPIEIPALATTISDLETFFDLYTRITGTGPNSMVTKFSEMATALGPAGEIVPGIMAGIDAIGNSFLHMQQTLEDKSKTGKEKFAANFEAMASVAQAVLSTVQNVYASISKTKIDNIDKEIAAEQKRDGKSAESLNKIDSMEKKKDSIARKAFNTNKKIMMAQAVIATATAATQALTLGPIAGPIMAAVIAALGAAQIAIIAGTSYQSASANTAKVTPPSLSIGKRGDSVDLAKQNNNVGGELGYLRGTAGRGSTSSNYAVVGSAYGGITPRGYGNAAMVVGEKGPEVIEPMTPMRVTPMNDNQNDRPVQANITIQALDSDGVADVMEKQAGNIISMLRKAANAKGERFMESVNINEVSRPTYGRRL